MKVTLEFFGGGPVDGTFSFDPSTPPPDHDSDLMIAWSFYKLTNGEVGKATQAASPAAIAMMKAGKGDTLKESGAKTHKYKVVKKTETENEIHVRAEYCQE